MKDSIDLIMQQLLYNPKDPLVFNSGFFLFFIALFFISYPFVYNHPTGRIRFFLFFSLFFFYKACGFFVGIIVLSAIVNYSLSIAIFDAQKDRHKRVLLLISILLNLGSLCFFKYTDLFIDLINGFRINQISALHLVLPIGISFYTFENLSYTIDVYKGNFKPTRAFIDYLFFLSFFPKLVMGPIVRASDFMPQIRRIINVDESGLGKGLYLIISGIVKKVIISDFIYSNYVQYIFDDPARHSGIECLIGIYGYAIVIYGDFSGYSDMAIGLAQWMGFSIPANFNFPYQASNITEFWHRWHISLSTWLKDYLYISLGGNRLGKSRQLLNLLITMLLGGLWHGANLKFVFWGGLHGLALIADKMVMPYRKALPSSGIIGSITKVLGILITFNFVCFCWIFFKAKDFTDALIIINQIAKNFNSGALLALIQGYKSVIALLVGALFLHFLSSKIRIKLEDRVRTLSLAGKAILLFIVIWLVIQVKQSAPILPIYLQF